MRKVLQQRDRANSRIIRKRARRKYRQKCKRLSRRQGFDGNGENLTSVVTFPPTLTIQNKRGRQAFLRSLDEFKRTIGLKPLYIDFRDTFLLYPSAVLLLVAEIDRVKRHLGSRFNAKILLPSDEVARQVFYQVGICELFDKEMPNERDHWDESVKHWRYATGTWMNDVPGKSLERFEGQLSEALQTGMWKGVSEAIVNSVHHAYLEERKDGYMETRETRWWMFSQVRDNELTVAVCDLGIGIPRSLPLNWGKAKVAELLAKFGLAKPEVSAIRAALEIGATRTGKGHRGRGLPQIWEDMKAHEGANLLLLSNRAILHWSSDTRSEQEREYPGSIFGTLMIWSVPLTARAKE